MKLFLTALCSLLAIACADLPTPVSPEQRVATSNGRILGGNSVTTGERPWHVWVRSAVGTASVTCGGSLIAANWVLTAAHCVQGYTSFTIGVGSNFLASPQIELTALNAIVHPEFNSANYNNDVALLQLAASLSESNTVAPILLPSVSETNTTFLNYFATVSGFGHVDNSTTELYPILQYVSMQVMTNVACANIYGSDVVTDNVLCANGAPDLTFGTCIGDSGGPMIIYASHFFDEPTLIGVVSFISSRGCGSRDPDGFARVSRFTKWINGVTGIPLRP